MKKWLLAGSLAAGCLTLSTPIAAETKILAFAGSTRANSYNKQLVGEAATIARQMGATVTVIDLKDYPMPFYDADLEKNQGMPENAKRLRTLMINSDAIIIASPEYNGSVSAVLKNTLDWASRSEDGQSSREAFKGKKFAIMSASPGQGGGARGLVHLQQIIENVGGEVVQKEVTVKQAYTVMSGSGPIEDAAIKQELEQEVQQLLPSKIPQQSQALTK